MSKADSIRRGLEEAIAFAQGRSSKKRYRLHSQSRAGGVRRRPTVHVVESVPDAELRAKEARALSAARRFVPSARRLKLYRTADGRIGCQLDVAVSAAEQKRLDQAYVAVMKVVEKKRAGRRG